MGEAKNQKVKKLARISLISLKWTVKEEKRKENPNEKIYWRKITKGKNKIKRVKDFPKIGIKSKRMGSPKRK